MTKGCRLPHEVVAGIKMTKVRLVMNFSFVVYKKIARYLIRSDLLPGVFVLDLPKLWWIVRAVFIAVDSLI